MGQAKKRGTFAERQAAAIARNTAMSAWAADPKNLCDHMAKQIRSRGPQAVSTCIAMVLDSSAVQKMNKTEK